MGPVTIDRIIRRMKEEGKQLHSEDWREGVLHSYEYNLDRERFIYTQIDTVAGSYMVKTEITEDEMRRILAQLSVAEIRELGFG